MLRSGRSRFVGWSDRQEKTKRRIDQLTTRQKGQASLELLLVLLSLLPLFLGGIELARGVSARHAINSGVGAATRALSLDPSQWTWANTVVQGAVSDNVMGGGNVSAPVLRAYDSNGSPLSAAALDNLSFGSVFQIEATATYQPDIPFVAGQGITLQARHWGIVERYP